MIKMAKKKVDPWGRQTRSQFPGEHFDSAAVKEELKAERAERSHDFKDGESANSKWIQQSMKRKPLDEKLLAEVVEEVWAKGEVYVKSTLNTLLAVDYMRTLNGKFVAKEFDKLKGARNTVKIARGMREGSLDSVRHATSPVGNKQRRQSPPAK